jgi:hypothetical protein
VKGSCLRRTLNAPHHRRSIQHQGGGFQQSHLNANCPRGSALPEMAWFARGACPFAMPETAAPAVDFSADADLISFLKAIPDGRYRRGVRYPQWSCCWWLCRAS